MARGVCSLVAAAAAALAGVAGAQTAAPAAPGGFVSAQLLVAPLSGDDTKELVLATATLAPGAATPVHRHPGDCIGSVIEGTVELRVPGQPPQRFDAGQAYSSPRGTTHQLANIGSAPARILNTLVVDKGKPRLELPPAQPK